MPVAVKVILGLMAAWGAAYSIIALVGDYALAPPPGSGRAEASVLEASVIYLHALNALAILLIFSFVAFNLRRLPVGYRVAWVFGFLFFYPLALPAFWWLHIWRSPRPTPPDARRPDGPS